MEVCPFYKICVHANLWGPLRKSGAQLRIWSPHDANLEAHCRTMQASRHHHRNLGDLLHVWDKSLAPCHGKLEHFVCRVFGD